MITSPPQEQRRFLGYDRLKQHVSMTQVLQRYGLLDGLRRFGDQLSGACPLHQGHNPTQFRVSLSRNCWICFGDCQAGGSIIDFVSRMEQVGIREAALLLQDWFDGAPPAPELPVPRALRSSNPPLRFQPGPLDSNHPYLKSRGVTPETLATFGVGLCAHGMLRGWIGIPIHDARGKLIALAGRWPGAPENGQPKYRLPRGFRKSIELFNQHRAIAEPASTVLVVVEGFFDCMKVWQAGHHRVVSLMGSRLSETQAERLVSIAGDPGIVLLFDGDAAGWKGAFEAARQLQSKVCLQLIRLEPGEQPDSMEPERLRNIIGRASA